MDYLQYLYIRGDRRSNELRVLNLIINGLPSIQTQKTRNSISTGWVCFKPYYKWITFNTYNVYYDEMLEGEF